MTKLEAIQKIKLSIAKGAQVITPKEREYNEFTKCLAQTLIDHVINPVEATLESACFPEYDFEKYKKSKVLAIAHMNDSWLLTLENENEFALGFGETVDNIMMYGFSSSDALGEWCA